jgi:uncharacterized membrane protein
VNTPSAMPPKGNLLRTVKAVAWSFIGIRKNSEYKEDLARVNPFHIIAVAIAGVVLFVGSLVLLVNWVVKG